MTDNNYKSFVSLLEDIDSEERSQRDRGTLFELLVVAYLENEPVYARRFDDIWKLSDVPEEYGIPKKDTGVDLVAKDRATGELIAIQCKFYSKTTKIRKEDIDSFLNEVGKSYYSKGIVVSSTDGWTANADEALNNRDKDIQRLGLSHFYESKVDWSRFSFSKPKEVTVSEKKTPRPHQIPAIKDVIEGFKNAERGMLIMAPGTGKTFTSLAIAEEMLKDKAGTFRVLYLVPSIQLLSQTLRSWNGDTNYTMDSIAVCSDRKVTKTKGANEIEDIAAADIGYPATTDFKKLLDYQKQIEKNDEERDMLTVFSTYQSIDVIIEAQKNGFYEFDLIVCDEAHRTTGSTELNKEDSVFTKVHYNSNIKATKRLYQTATPKVYGEDAKKKAEDNSVVIADMNDPELYGEEFHRIGFGEAVRKGILTDYKVMILAVDENVVAKRFQKMLADEKELKFDDVTKIIGCWNGLIRRKSDSDMIETPIMKRAIAFTGTINESKLITEMFERVVDEYLYETEESFAVEIQHADGSMNALQKNEKIAWLKSEVPENTCRILSNARFLTEGVDIPDLDAVMFLKPRRSKIDIAQAVGRVMRKAEGKEYGYVILPIGVPAGVDENAVLDNNANYAVVWEVLNALRSLDERFDSMINKLELNKKKPSVIGTRSVGDAPKGGFEKPEDYQISADFSEWSDLERAIYGKIVKKVGNVRYWEDWSKDVAKIARQHMTRISVMLEDTDSVEYQEFQKFLKGLRYNLNNSITEAQAIEMLAQHMITKPVFESLFDSYEFVKINPVSKSMEAMITLLDRNGLSKEQEGLEGFYESVRIRAEGVDNLEGKQKIIIQLYDKFFRVGFKETTEQLGIVFTPTEVVDFIIHSVDNVLQKHFGKSLGSEGVHVLDPFTGTGTFVTCLLQSGLISKDNLLRKYTQEIHANEIVLLSYYIAAINIEETFHSLTKGEYVPFEGIVLTDTFESTEHKESMMNELFDENNVRLQKQQEQPIFAIIGNPPYRIGKNNANDSNDSVSYPQLENRIADTYAKFSNSTAKNTLYDSYIKAIRWSTDRISDKGVIGFVTNGSFIDSNATNGLRKCLAEDFNYLYIFNLRGDQRTQGEISRKEGGKIFGSGSRTPIAITILVKDGSEKREIYYHDIGDYLSREEKLQIIADYKSINNIEWESIEPDKNYDWINLRNESYDKFIPLYASEGMRVFNNHGIGAQTARDAWTYGFDKENVSKNVKKLIDNYNAEFDRLSDIIDIDEKIEKLNTNDDYIKWTRGMRNSFKRGKKFLFDKEKIIYSHYRPFTKKWLYYNSDVVEYPAKYKDMMGEQNKVIFVTGTGIKRDFSAIMIETIPNYHLMDTGQAFLLYDNSNENNLLNENSNIYEPFRNLINLNDEEIFYYVYAVLHSNEYKEKYANDLKKSLPRIPILKHKEKFVEIGRKLAELHLNYEEAPLFEGVTIQSKSNPSYKVTKLKHPKKSVIDKIVLNNDITICDIPLKAYEYIINGRPAIEWFIDQYQIKQDKKSGIIDDPNMYSDDEKYILNLLLRIINVSVQTVDLVNSLPQLEIIE